MENYHFQTLLPPLTGNSLPFLLFISEHFLPSFILWFMVHWSSPESRYTWKMVAVCIRERERERECLQFCFPQTGRLQFPVSDGSQSFPDKQKLTRTQPAPHPVRHSFMSGNNKTFLRLLTTTSLR